MIIHKVAQPSISVVIGYFITNLSFNLQVKEFVKTVNIWRSYKCVIRPIRKATDNIQSKCHAACARESCHHPVNTSLQQVYCLDSYSSTVSVPLNIQTIFTLGTIVRACSVGELGLGGCSVGELEVDGCFLGVVLGACLGNIATISLNDSNTKCFL